MFSGQGSPGIPELEDGVEQRYRVPQDSAEHARRKEEEVGVSSQDVSYGHGGAQLEGEKALHADGACEGVQLYRTELGDGEGGLENIDQVQ